jgi:hypothetical protein
LAESENREWSVEKSPARNHVPNAMGSAASLSSAGRGTSAASSASSLSSYYGGNQQQQQANLDSGGGGYNGGGGGGTDNRYQGFGNTPAPNSGNDGSNELLTGAMSSLSIVKSFFYLIEWQAFRAGPC